MAFWTEGSCGLMREDMRGWRRRTEGGIESTCFVQVLHFTFDYYSPAYARRNSTPGPDPA